MQQILEQQAVVGTWRTN
jgi:hypothetical protein